MSAPIKAGDLVMIVRPTPCCGRVLMTHGVPWTVGLVFPKTVQMCDLCMTVQEITYVVSDRAHSDGRYIAATPGMLIKIDPPAVSDEREVKAPAEVA